MNIIEMFILYFKDIEMTDINKNGNNTQQNFIDKEEYVVFKIPRQIYDALLEIKIYLNNNFMKEWDKLLELEDVLLLLIRSFYEGVEEYIKSEQQNQNSQNKNDN